MTLALAVLTDIDVKFIFDHNQLYSFAAVTQTCPEHVIPIIRNVCVVRPVEKGASTDDGANLVRCALSNTKYCAGLSGSELRHKAKCRNS